MSGGVDSSVAALLLHRKGFDVSGLFMKNWEDDDPDYPCTAKEDAMDAMDVCDLIGIEMDAVTFVEEYQQRVFRHFLDEYQRGRTPNPDILCNKEIKFKAFLDYALAHGAHLIATGHYARIVEEDGQYHLLKAKDLAKDQSYFLYALHQSQLARSLFPLSELTKPEVRKLAAEANFAVHNKKDSTGICFIGERKFKRFLSRYVGAQPGMMRTPDGEVVGEHDGLTFYTLGQRQGLGIGGRRDNSGEPWFVVAKDVESNQLVVAQGHDHPMLFSYSLRGENLHWIANTPPKLPLRCKAKTRYRQTDQPCTVTSLDRGGCEVVFDQPQRAVTPGQSVVFYQGDVCLGGAVIADAQR